MGEDAMKYLLRLVQTFDKSVSEEFLELERKFAELEKEDSSFPRGVRYVPCFSQQANNTLIWEAEFNTMEELLASMNFVSNNPRHEELYQKQKLLMRDVYTEIYERFCD
jgi:hypothetical protein